MTSLVKFDFVILLLLLVERLNIFQKIKKALLMLFLQTIILNLVLTKSSGPKCHVVALTMMIFAGFCTCHTDLSGEGGRQVERVHNVELSWPDPILPTLLSVLPLCKTCLSWPRAWAGMGRSAPKFVGRSAHGLQDNTLQKGHYCEG
jgi:hypothetical protein